MSEREVKCPRCLDVGWLWGRELEDPDDDTYSDTLTRYTRDHPSHRPLPDGGVLREVGNVVERLEELNVRLFLEQGNYEMGLPQYEEWGEWRLVIANALTLIHDLQVEAASQERWADGYKAERDRLADRLTDEEIAHTGTKDARAKWEASCGTTSRRLVAAEIELDRIATENIEQTTRIGELVVERESWKAEAEAENARLLKNAEKALSQAERFEEALNQIGYNQTARRPYDQDDLEEFARQALTGEQKSTMLKGSRRDRDR